MKKAKEEKVILDGNSVIIGDKVMSQKAFLNKVKLEMMGSECVTLDEGCKIVTSKRAKKYIFSPEDYNSGTPFIEKFRLLTNLYDCKSELSERRMDRLRNIFHDMDMLFFDIGLSAKYAGNSDREGVAASIGFVLFTFSGVGAALATGNLSWLFTITTIIVFPAITWTYGLIREFIDIHSSEMKEHNERKEKIKNCKKKVKEYRKELKKIKLPKENIITTQNPLIEPIQEVVTEPTEEVIEIPKEELNYPILNMLNALVNRLNGIKHTNVLGIRAELEDLLSDYNFLINEGYTDDDIIENYQQFFKRAGNIQLKINAAEASERRLSINNVSRFEETKYVLDKIHSVNTIESDNMKQLKLN